MLLEVGGYLSNARQLMYFVIFMTLGNAVNFGDLTPDIQNEGACSSSTRGLWGGGHIQSRQDAN